MRRSGREQGLAPGEGGFLCSPGRGLGWPHGDALEQGRPGPSGSFQVGCGGRRFLCASQGQRFLSLSRSSFQGADSWISCPQIGEQWPIPFCIPSPVTHTLTVQPPTLLLVPQELSSAGKCPSEKRQAEVMQCRPHHSWRILPHLHPKPTLYSGAEAAAIPAPPPAKPGSPPVAAQRAPRRGREEAGPSCDVAVELATEKLVVAPALPHQ